MSQDAQHFRSRAADCRKLARSARDVRDSEMLNEIADELDEEARKIEAHCDPTEAARPNAKLMPD
jgi:hypothetical protein